MAGGGGGPVWEVVGGSDKGGIVVRTGKDVSSPLEALRLSTGALVRELELDDQRLRYLLLAGAGPKTGWVSTKLQNGKDLLVRAGGIWEVVGGGDKGGVIVRRGQDVTSPQDAQRLSTGAVVKEVALVGDRLHFRRLAGRGPDAGWVSVRLAAGGRDLLVRCGGGGAADAAAAGAEPPPTAAGGGRGDASAGLGEAVLARPALFAVPEAREVPEPLPSAAQRELDTPLAEFLPLYWRRWAPEPGPDGGGSEPEGLEAFLAGYWRGWSAGEDPRGSAPGRPSELGEVRDEELEARRATALRLAESPADSAQAAAAPPPDKFAALRRADLLKLAPQALPGEVYGLKVPPSLSDLEQWGAAWLTEAFRAAGTLPPDNSMRQVVEFRRLPTNNKDAAGGQGPKAILTVEYEREDASLHRRLFVKMPWAVSGAGGKEMGVDVDCRAMLQVDDYQEQAVYRFLGPRLPFRIPKYYFGDVCRANNNSIIIVEAVSFGERGQRSFEPFEVLPLCEKYLDFQLPPALQADIYYCLMRAQARLAAWYQLGLFKGVPPGAINSGAYPPLPGSGEFPNRLSEEKRQGRRRNAKVVVDAWREFLGDKARRCYPAELTEESFLDALVRCVEDTCAYDKEIKDYFRLFPDFIALQHPNLNADNAYFWRDDRGRLDCGVFDWSGAAPMNVVQMMTGSLTGAEGHVQDAHDCRWLWCFREEYRRECGICLDLGEMRRQWHLTYCLYMLYLAMRIRDSVFEQTKGEEWSDISSLWDERVVDRWNVRCYSFMVGHCLRYLHLRWTRGGRRNLHIHDTLLEWMRFWTGHGLS